MLTKHQKENKEKVFSSTTLYQPLCVVLEHFFSRLFVKCSFLQNDYQTCTKLLPILSDFFILKSMSYVEILSLGRAGRGHSMHSPLLPRE